VAIRHYLVSFNVGEKMTVHKKVLVLTVLVWWFCTGVSIAQQERQDSKATAEKERQELRLKACGTESVNYKATTDKKQHPIPDAPADKAMIYVMRTTILGYKIHSKLAVDGKWMGVNRGKTYFFFTLDPGEHYFCSEAENQDYLALTVEAGKTYYLKQRVVPGIWKARTDLAIIDDEKAKKELADVNLSVFTLKDK
jgi:Protein of unknown function (DUF2846)